MFFSILNRTILSPKFFAFFEWYEERILLRFFVTSLMGGLFFLIGGGKDYYHAAFPFLINLYLMDAYTLRGLAPAGTILLGAAVEHGEDSDYYISRFICINYFVAFLIMLAYVLDVVGYF